MSEGERKGEKVFKAVPVSGGVCQGRVVVLGRAVDSLPHYDITENAVDGEMQRLNAALVETRHQILEVQRKVGESIGSNDASIFDAHLLLLEDQTILDEVTRQIRSRKVNIEQVYNDVIRRYLSALAAIKDPYLSERSADLEDIATRVLANLLGREHNTLLSIDEPSIIITHDLTPSTTAQMDKKMVLGFITEAGSKTSHTAIMARALQIPAMVGLADATRNLHTGDYVLLDGYNGLLILNPTDQSLFEYGKLMQKQEALLEKLRDVVHKPSITLDGRAITLSANIGQPEDKEAVIASGAEGVGLFRSEFLFLNRDTPPGEDEQFEAYRSVADALKPHPVVIRTLDLGGDKFNGDSHAPGGAESIPRVACDPLLPPGEGGLPDPAPGHPPSLRSRQC